MAYVYEYPRPSVTATIIVQIEDPDRFIILLGKRKSQGVAYAGYLALPGGFLDARVDYVDCLEPKQNSIREGETVEQTAMRELFEETNLSCLILPSNIFRVWSGPYTDYRAHVVNVVYHIKISAEQYAQFAKAGDDLEELQLAAINEDWLKKTDMAFNHKEIVADAYIRYG